MLWMTMKVLHGGDLIVGATRTQ